MSFVVQHEGPIGKLGPVVVVRQLFEPWEGVRILLSGCTCDVGEEASRLRLAFFDGLLVLLVELLRHAHGAQGLAVAGLTGDEIHHLDAAF